MKSTMYLTILVLLCVQSAYTQKQPYFLEVLSDTYGNLENSISLNNGEVWDDPTYTVPIGFSFDFFDRTYNNIYFYQDGLGGTLAFDANVVNHRPLLIPYGSDVIDRGIVDSVSVSEISYLLEGDHGSRILKLEWKNAGFYNEAEVWNHTNSFVNFQLWLYEGSNAFEMRFGESYIEDDELVHEMFTGPLVGFVDSVINYGENFRRLYYLTGKPESPFLNSVNSNAGADTITKLLLTTPPEGIVYRFSDVSVATHQPSAQNSSYSIHPTIAKDYLHVEGSEGVLTDGLQYAITSSDGKLVSAATPLYGNRINLPNLPTGYYYLQLKDNSRRQTNLPFFIK